jgi:hypothetical protein
VWERDRDRLAARLDETALHTLQHAVWATGAFNAAASQAARAPDDDSSDLTRAARRALANVARAEREVGQSATIQKVLDAVPLIATGLLVLAAIAGIFALVLVDRRASDQEVAEALDAVMPGGQVVDCKRDARSGRYNCTALDASCEQAAAVDTPVACPAADNGRAQGCELSTYIGFFADASTIARITGQDPPADCDEDDQGGFIDETNGTRRAARCPNAPSSNSSSTRRTRSASASSPDTAPAGRRRHTPPHASPRPRRGASRSPPLGPRKAPAAGSRHGRRYGQIERVGRPGTQCRVAVPRGRSGHPGHTAFSRRTSSSAASARPRPRLDPCVKQCGEHPLRTALTAKTGPRARARDARRGRLGGWRQPNRRASDRGSDRSWKCVFRNTALISGSATALLGASIHQVAIGAGRAHRCPATSRSRGCRSWQACGTTNS